MKERHKEGEKQSVQNDDTLSLLFMLFLLFFAKVPLCILGRRGRPTNRIVAAGFPGLGFILA